MQLNTLIIAQRDGNHRNSYSIELDYRLSGLLALYRANTDDPRADYFSYRKLAIDFISRGGQIHCVSDQDGRVLGSVYMMTTHSLLQNLYPVERLFIETDESDHETQISVADRLIASIIQAAEIEVAKHPLAGSIWIQLTLPEGALGHPESQPIYGALEAHQFQGISVQRAEFWIRLIAASSAMRG